MVALTIEERRLLRDMLGGTARKLEGEILADIREHGDVVPMKTQHYKKTVDLYNKINPDAPQSMTAIPLIKNGNGNGRAWTEHNLKEA